MYTHVHAYTIYNTNLCLDVAGRVSKEDIISTRSTIDFRGCFDRDEEEGGRCVMRSRCDDDPEVGGGDGDGEEGGAGPWR